MRLEDLFEKRERAIFQACQILQDQAGPVLIKDLCDQLELSRSTFLRYLAGFSQEAQEAGLGLTLQVTGEQLVAYRQPDLPQSAYLSFFANNSLKCQILRAVFDRQEFSLQGLSQELLISEASLSRQLAALNQLLQEFGLSIRNGRLKGSELQIRYLYFHLAWLLGPSSLPDVAGILSYQAPAVKMFERLYESHFSNRQSAQLQLWLAIGHKRMRQGHLDFDDLYARMRPYQNHKFYLRLREVGLTLFAQQAGGWQEGELMCLFVFLFFHGVLGPARVEQMVAFGGPVQEATSLGLSVLRNLQADGLILDEEAMYQLNQVLGQLYFFDGRLVATKLALTYQGEQGRFLPLLDQLLQGVCQEVYQKPLPQGDVLLQLRQDLFSLCHYMTMEVPAPLVVGVSLSSNRVAALPLLQALRTALEQNRHIAVEEWQEGQTYDLLISDDQTSDNQPVYLLYGSRLTKGDLAALKNLLHQLSRSKTDQPLYRRTGSRLGS